MAIPPTPSPRPLGINAIMNVVAEPGYGTTPATGFQRVPFVSHSLGEEQPLIEDDQLGFGREGLDPTPGVITNDGDVVVPVDLRAIGFWLRQTFGAPSSVTTGATTAHTFTSGAQALPSTSIEIGNQDASSYSTHFGAVVNSLKIQMARSGLLNATISLIAQGEADPTVVSIAGTPAVLRGPRFAQAAGAVTIDGITAASVASAEISYSNQLDKVEVIRPDGRIGGVDPGKAMTSGSIVAVGPAGTLFNKARAKVSAGLSFGWTNGSFSLIFTLPRVWLPKPKRPISGPKGIQSTFNYQASGAEGAQLTVVLTNDVTSYL